jgi:predicted ester cyclase
METVTPAWAFVEQHRSVVRRMLASLSGGDVEGFVTALSPGYVRHCQAMPPELQEIRGRDAMRQFLLGTLETFPDWHEEIETLVCEGEYLAWRSTGTGTHLGALGPFQPTGRRVRVEITGMHRFEHGEVAETWTSWDNLDVMRQLGLLP